MPLPQETLEWVAELRETISPLMNVTKDTNLEAVLKEFIPTSEERAKAVSALTNQIPFSAKKVVAAAIYYGLDIRYGFEEAIKTGNWAPWPDESSEVNCYGQSIATFLVAKACGLNPIQVDFAGFRPEERTQRGGHSSVIVDVGKERPERWLIDQAWNMYGPLTWGVNTFTIENLDAKNEKTHRNDYRTKTFDFITTIISDEERIVAHVEQLRANPESVLYPGQRMGIPLLDKWQSEEALEAPWFLQFIPNRSKEDHTKYRGDLVSRIEIARPGIKSRGLEYKIKIGNDNTIEEEKVVGYYCNGTVWTDFVNSIPMISISPEELIPLLDGVAEIAIQERPDFERTLMKESTSSEQSSRILAARKSFESLRESEYGNAVSAISAVEALYQHEKSSKPTYLTPTERQAAIKKYKTTHRLFAYYANAAEYLKQNEKTRARWENRLFNRSKMLRPNQQEDPRMKAFLALEKEEERVQHIMGHKPTYIDDAIDRLVFYDRKIKGKEAQVKSIARSAFGDNYGRAVFSGYVRIFAEFLGHFSVTLPQLCLHEYKQKILDKLNIK